MDEKEVKELINFIEFNRELIEKNTIDLSTNTIIERWFNYLLNKDLDLKDLLTDGAGYLIMGKATSHYDSNIIIKLQMKIIRKLNEYIKII